MFHFLALRRLVLGCVASLVLLPCADALELNNGTCKIWIPDSVTPGQIQGVISHFNYGGNNLYNNTNWRSFCGTRKMAMVLLPNQDNLTANAGTGDYTGAATTGLGMLSTVLTYAAANSSYTELSSSWMPYVFTGISRGGTLGALNHGWTAGANKTLAVIAFHGGSLDHYPGPGGVSYYYFPAISSVPVPATSIPVLYKVAQNEDFTVTPQRQSNIESYVRETYFRVNGCPWTTSMDYGYGHSNTGSDTYTLKWLGRVIDARFDSGNLGVLKTNAMVDGGTQGIRYAGVSLNTSNYHFTTAQPSAGVTYSKLDPGQSSKMIWLPPGGVDEWIAENITPVRPTISAVTAGATQVAINASTGLSVTGSSPFGESIAFAWTVDSAPVGGSAAFSASTSASTNVTFTGAGGTYVLRATVTNSPANLTATNTVSIRVLAPPTVATPAAATPATLTGTSTALSVLGADESGESALTYTWSTTGTPPAAVSFSPNGTHAAQNAVATFTQAGTYQFQVLIRDPDSQTVVSTTSCTVTAVPTSATITPSSASVVVGTTQSFSVAVVDQFGATSAGTPAWSITGGGTIDAGTGLFTAGGTAGGPFTVTATVGSLTPTAQVSVTPAANAAPSLTQPATAPSPVSGTTAALSVLATDDGGDAAVRYTWSVLGTPPAPVTFSANGSNGAATTTATFTRAGSYQFQVVAMDLAGASVTSTVNVVVSATPSTVVVSPSSASVVQALTRTFSAQVTDQFGQPLVATPVWSVSGGGSIDASTGIFTASTVGGPFTVTATLPGPVTGTASVTVTPAPPTIATAPASVAVSGDATSLDLSVLGADLTGESGLTYTWSVLGTPPGSATFSVNGSNAAKQTRVTLTAAGSYTFRVTVLAPTTLTVTADLIVNMAQAVTTLSVAPSSTTLVVGLTQTYAATAVDQFGNAMTIAPTWSATGSGAIGASSGVFTAGLTTGSFTVTATAPGGMTASATGTVVNTAPTVAQAPAALVGSSGVIQLSVLGADDGTEASLTYTWSQVSGAPSSVIAGGTHASRASAAIVTQAGTYVYQVTIMDRGGLSVVANVTVTVAQSLNGITVTPASASLVWGQTRQFTATGIDQFGNAMVVTPTWSVNGGGTISSGGLFTAGARAADIGTWQVLATASGRTGAATLSVAVDPSAADLDAPVISGVQVPVLISTASVQVTIQGTDLIGITRYVWTLPTGVTISSLTSATPTLSFTGAGSYVATVVAYDAAGNASTAFTVNLLVVATPARVEFIPADLTIPPGARRTLSVSLRDQFNGVVLDPATYTWTVDGAVLATPSRGSCVIDAPVSGTVSVRVSAATAATAVVGVLPIEVLAIVDDGSGSGSGGCGQGGGVALLLAGLVLGIRSRQRRNLL